MVTLIVTAVMSGLTLVISQAERICRMTAIGCAFCGSFSQAMADGARSRSRHNSGQSFRDRLRSARRNNRSTWYAPPDSTTGGGCGEEMGSINPQPGAEAEGEEESTGAAGGPVVPPPEGGPGGKRHAGSSDSSQGDQAQGNSLNNIGRVGTHKHID